MHIFMKRQIENMLSNVTLNVSFFLDNTKKINLDLGNDWVKLNTNVIFDICCDIFPIGNLI